VPTIVIALLLVAHGLVHAFFVIPQPPETAGGPSWPFDLARSWILTPAGVGASGTRTLGIALLAAVVVGYVLAGVGVVAGAEALFLPGIAIGSVASLAMLGVFFKPWLTLGVAIDVALLVAAFAMRWRPGGTGL
jgi:hypothetical protein